MEDRQQSGAAVLGEAIGGLLGALWAGQPVFRFKDPVTHKIVCECVCWADQPSNTGGLQGSYQTFDERQDCGTLNGINCQGTFGAGKLGSCEKKSVPTRLAPEQVRDDLLVKSER